MRFSQTNSTQEDDVGFVFEERQAKEVLHLGRLIFLGQFQSNWSRVLRQGKRTAATRRWMASWCRRWASLSMSRAR